MLDETLPRSLKLFANGFWPPQNPLIVGILSINNTKA
jgi:hypothetical protein